MKKETAELALGFLQRVQLTGVEVSSFNEVTIALVQEIKDGTDGPADSDGGPGSDTVGD